MPAEQQSFKINSTEMILEARLPAKRVWLLLLWSYCSEITKCVDVACLVDGYSFADFDRLRICAILDIFVPCSTAYGDDRFNGWFRLGFAKDGGKP